MTHPLTSIKTAQAESFVYTPPMAAYDAVRIFVLVAMGNPAAQVSAPVLGKVLRGLRRADPHGRILVVSGTYNGTRVKDIFTDQGVPSLMDDNMRAADTEELIMAEYTNPLETPVQYETLIAPGYIRDYDCVISVSTFQPERPAAIHNLHSALSRTENYADHNAILPDIYAALGQHIDGAVIEVGERVVWGDDLLAVDEAAYRLAGVPAPEVLTTLRQMHR